MTVHKAVQTRVSAHCVVGSIFDDLWDSLLEILLRELEQVVPSESSVAYFGYPVHDNVGDLLIYLGTEQWIRDCRLRVVGRYHGRERKFPKLSKGTIVLGHGGGNFGDIYPHHQRYRETLCERYHNHRVVFLPQTVYFRDRAVLRESMGRLNQHPDLHVLVRDDTSYATLEDIGVRFRVRCAPDMATFLFPMERSFQLSCVSGGKGKLLALMREDVEKTSYCLPEWVTRSGQPSWVGDWRSLMSWHLYPLAAIYVVGRYLWRWLPSAAFACVWKSLATSVIAKCSSRFLEHDTVVTSRLHGHILATLLRRPSIVFDNSYGKNCAYFDKWHGVLSQ